MKAGFLSVLCICMIYSHVNAQKKCYSSDYRTNEIRLDPSLSEKFKNIETATENFISQQGTVANRGEESVIRIPVVVHILYHTSAEKITDADVYYQIAALNNCFRRRSADTAQTPSYFKPLAADCNIEFQLAISDPKQRATTGIIRKYTPVARWDANDKMKFSSQAGDDAWDPSSYLNIWVCNLDMMAGYSTFPDAAKEKDGLVIAYNVFGSQGSTGYNMGKTAVHEIGHWLNLKHIWGDTYCGDDGVSDTPKQAGFNVDCPSGKLITCNNAPYGDMYMNYMDFTSDACMNLFTTGQKLRMRALFSNGGARSSILLSKGLNPPLIAEAPLPEADPQWYRPNLYPNPATAEMTLDLTYDARWMGKKISITNLQGQTLMSLVITNKEQKISIRDLTPGLYFLVAKKDDGESLKLKFIKL